MPGHQTPECNEGNRCKLSELGVPILVFACAASVCARSWSCSADNGHKGLMPVVKHILIELLLYNVGVIERAPFDKVS